MGTFLLWFQGDTFNVVQHAIPHTCCPAGSRIGRGAFREPGKRRLEPAACRHNGHAAMSTIRLTKKRRIMDALGWPHPARLYPSLSVSLPAARGKLKTFAAGYGPTVSVTLVGL